MTGPVIDLDAERAELLAMHAAVRQAHFDTDPDGVIANDAGECVRVRRTQGAETLVFEYAGIETYEKRDSRWVKTTETGTFKIIEGGEE